MTLFAPLSVETRRILDGVPALIDRVFPLPGRFRSALPANVAELSRLLTSGRGERSLSYMGRPALLSAYLRFFLPWNLYRLCRLLPGLDIKLASGDRISDLGCGPLTLTLALWICRPDLRSLPLEFHCIDRSGPALDAGKKIFAALAGEDSPWKIHTARSDIAAKGTSSPKETPPPKSAALVCAVNVFNEMYGDISRNGHPDIMRRNAEKSARLLESHGSAASRILVVEPGFPRCGEFISLLRGVFLEKQRRPLSPCPHDADCPFSKKRWCHFAFETEDAPAALHRLSQAAALPKERATLSFLFTGPVTRNHPLPTPHSPLPFLRVISDAFPLPSNRNDRNDRNGRFGRYCCSAQGLVLFTGDKTAIEKNHSGALVQAVINNDKRDLKSGALIAE